MPTNIGLRKILLAGLLASIAMLAAMYGMQTLGGPPLDVIALLSTLSTQYGAWVPAAQFAVLSLAVFPFIYATMLFYDLPGPPWQRGLIWGLILFALRGAVVMPIMGQGFFGVQAEHAVAALLQLFVAHCVYGLVLGGAIGDIAHRRVRSHVTNRSPSMRR
jgi:hypothetical protein